MPDRPATPTMFGGRQPAHLPDQAFLADLERAVVLGGEGGTLTLLGPHTGAGDLRPLHFSGEGVDEEGFSTRVDLSLTSFGPDLLAALDRLQPEWRRMVGVHVSSRWEETLRADLERHGHPYEFWRHSFGDPPLRCIAAWPACSAWPDGRVQDGYWLQGTLDQARALVGRLGFDHQVQLRTAPCEPFGVLVSRDATQRIPLDPHYPISQMWSVSPFIEIEPFEIADLTDLEGVLAAQPVLRPAENLEDVQPSTLDRLLALPFDGFVEVAAQVMATFGATVDVETLPGPVVHLQGFLNLGSDTAVGILPLVLSAHVEQSPLTLTAGTIERLRAHLHPGMPGMIITTGTFSPDADEAAYDAPVPPVGLIDGTQLARLVEQFDLLPPLETP